MVFLLVGFSHNPDYRLFHLGETASEAIQEFAETGSSGTLEKMQNNVNQLADTTANGTAASTLHHTKFVLDGFTAPPIQQGVGTSEATIFVDGNHTLVRKSNHFATFPNKAQNPHALFIFPSSITVHLIL